MDNGNPDFAEILAALKTIQREMDAREQEARETLKAIIAERKRIDQTIRAAEGTGQYAGRSAEKKPAGSVSAETIERIWNAIQKEREPVIEDAPGSFSIRQLSTELGMTETTIRLAIQHLREENRVRLVGERRLNPRGSRATRIFAVA
jgi:hypothetical protein